MDSERQSREQVVPRGSMAITDRGQWDKVMDHKHDAIHMSKVVEEYGQSAIQVKQSDGSAAHAKHPWSAGTGISHTLCYNDPS